MATSEPRTYILGTSTITTQEDHSITIENETLALLLNSDEAYKLLLVLQELFK